MGLKGGKPPGSTQPQVERGLHLQQSSHGDCIPIRYGENRMAAHVLLAAFFKAIRVPLSATAGVKKGGGQAAYQYTYTVSVILDLGEGEVPLDPTGNPYNPLRKPELNNVGLARPGRQSLSVHETGQQPLGQDRFVDGGAVPTNPDGTPRLQPLRGTEPGTWRGKNVRHMGPAADNSAFKGTHWHEFAPGRFIAIPADDFPPFYEGGQHDKLVTPGTRHYAPERYTGLSPLAYRNMPLGPNASLPGWNFPYTRMRYAEFDGPGMFVPAVSTPAGVRDCAPDHILADLLGNWKHGVSEELLPLLPGYDPALGDASPFWNVHPEDWGAYCRANEILLSPYYDAQQPMSQWLEDLALLTDTALVFSEGLFKMIPYGTAAATGPVTGITFTPVTDPTAPTTGANIGALPFTADDFLSGGPAKDDAVVVVRKALLKDERTSPGYFNAIRVEFVNRLNAYAKEIAEAKDEAAIAAHGLVAGQPLNANGVTSVALANDIARRYLQRVGQLRDEYRFTVGWQQLLLEPMDIRTIPGEVLDPALTGHLIAVRIREITENDRGELEVLAQRVHDPLVGSAPETVPGPDDSPDVDGTTVLAGGMWTAGNPNWTQVAPYFYTDPTGSAGADFGTTGQPVPGTPTRAYAIEAEDILIAGWAVRFQERFEDANGVDVNDSIPANVRLRVNVEGESRPELEINFALNELHQTKFAPDGPLQGPLSIPAGSRWSVEAYMTDGNGLPIVPRNTGGGVIVPTVPPRAFTWTFVVEPA